MTLILDDDEGPVQPAKAPKVKPHTNGHMPESEAQDYLLGCCLLDEGITLDRATAKGLTPDHLSSRHGLIFRSLQHLRSHQIPIGLDTLAEHLGPRINQAGGIQSLMDLADPIKIGTTARVDYQIGRLIQERDRYQAIQAARLHLQRLEAGEDIPAATLQARSPSDFNLVPDDDRSILLGNRFLNRGDGAVISSTSGMGKSSLSLQLAVLWALGRPALGIKSNGPLRSLIIQSEDSDGDVAEVMASIRHVLQLTPQEITLINERVRIITDRVNRGDPFLNQLRKHVSVFHPDLVWINPLQAFMAGDVTDSQDLGAFLRGGLNGLNQPPTFGYILIHHTTKPATGKDRSERLWHETMYDMAGGAEIINWARAIMSLRASEQEGNFNLVLAKRGRRAGVAKEVEQGAGTVLEPVTTIPLKHATGRIQAPGIKRGLPIIFWEGREPDQQDPKDQGRGRPAKFNYHDFRGCMPKASEPGRPFTQILKALAGSGGPSKGSLSSVLEKWAEQGCIEIIRPETGPALYRSTI